MFEVFIVLLIVVLVALVVALAHYGAKLTQELEAERAMHAATQFMLNELQANTAVPEIVKRKPRTK
jgi:hypothetical protein